MLCVRPLVVGHCCSPLIGLECFFFFTPNASDMCFYVHRSLLAVPIRHIQCFSLLPNIIDVCFPLPIVLLPLSQTAMLLPRLLHCKICVSPKVGSSLSRYIYVFIYC